MTLLEREAIPTPPTGLLVYQIDGEMGFYFYNGILWTSLEAENQTLADVLVLGNTANSQLKNVTDPTDIQDAATKAYVDLLEARITALEPIEIGDIREDGTVFYLAPIPTDLDGDGNLDTGLVCALSDFVTSTEWGCFLTDLPNVPNVPLNGGIPIGLGTVIGDGMGNTNGILVDCPSTCSLSRSYIRT